MTEKKQKKLTKLNDYWINRAKKRIAEDIRDTEMVVELINNQYDLALSRIEKDIATLFYRYSSDNELSYTQAIELLTSDEYKEFRMDLASYMAEIDDPNILLELNTLSTKSRITRLERTFYDIQKEVDKTYIYQHKEVEDLMQHTLNNSYKKTLFNIAVGENITKKSYHMLTKKEILKEFEKPWSGKNFSQRIWNNRTKLKDALEEEIIQAAIQGTNTSEAVKRVQDKFKVSKKNATRLIRTEQSYFSSLGNLKAFKELGVEEYIYIATLDLRTSNICRDLDHEVFKREEAIIGVKFPPMHPNCRSTTAPYTGELKGTRIARDENGKNIRVDKNINYKQWHKEYVESNPNYIIEEKKWKNRHSDKRQYKKYKDVGVEVPKSFDKYQDLKYNGSERDRRLRMVDYTRRVKLKNNPELKLPNVGTATIDKNKFEKYLFAGDNEKGLNKGRLIEEKLGYNIDNYDKFEKEILSRAKYYPATLRGTTTYGQRYEQQIIFYNKNKEPVNVLVAWLENNGKTHMSTAYITEVK